MKTFRIDDVSLNSCPDKLFRMISVLDRAYPKSNFLLGISPLVCDMDGIQYTGCARERIFPAIFNAYSDYRCFYNVDKCGIPSVIQELVRNYGSQIQLAGHGLIHVDHRLLHRDVQELSILVSCSLVGAKTYIPPFNKYDDDTEDICFKAGIKLIRFEDGWRHLCYEKIVQDKYKYYFHTHDFNLDEFVSIVGGGN